MLDFHSVNLPLSVAVINMSFGGVREGIPLKFLPSTIEFHFTGGQDPVPS